MKSIWKHTWNIVVVLLMLAPVRITSQGNEWNNPSMHIVGAEPGRTSFFYYRDVQTALKNQPEVSPYYRSLNGLWKFHWCRKPEERPGDFYTPDYDASNWSEIEVPGEWQLQGYGVPIDFNIGFGFENRFPLAPEDYNSVGSYLRYFTIPSEWKGMQVFLHFAGVSSA